ncbi:restriction endonuclease subunit S [Tabrizicola sp. J26]|uniref:restriction endonuclease subunit S n=1 Tax=Alitabrizicola rongguiensis TaxID=2909234 RepID=UPI001F20654E|nr:restriction endonuclease subunit S [Tabrizicola rongguiensis]MCF1708728.1 restriction endonuclease subunit S [Tabrizicola rongguiensis]
MNGEWKAFKLDELGFVGRGKSRHRPRNDPRLYGGRYPFFQTGDVKAAELYLREHEATYNELGLAQSKLWQPGTLCITIAANIAESAILTIPGCFPDSVVGFVADPNLADTKFIKYRLDTLKLAMQAASLGTTQDNLSLDKLLRFDFLVPPLPTQQRIAAILSAYDDLLQNNTRRIAILEEMARRLYEEWFVHFRFPGHEEAEFDGDEEERLPKGWARTGLYDVADVVYGHPFKSGLFNTDGQGLGVVRIRDVIADRASASTTEEGKPQHRLSNGDILVGMDGAFYLGRWAGGDAWLNQRVCCLRPKPWMPRHLLFQTVASPIKRLEETIVGTTVAHLSARDMKQMQIVLPDQRGLDLAMKHLEPSYGQILTLKRKNANLHAQRDMLLPKLISGEIDVSGAEELLEAAE